MGAISYIIEYEHYLISEFVNQQERLVREKVLREERYRRICRKRGAQSISISIHQDPSNTIWFGFRNIPSCNAEIVDMLSVVNY